MPALAPDLTKLRVGAKVKLRGDVKPQPRKPYPRGWCEVAELGYHTTDTGAVHHHVVRVVGDVRWLPVYLIEEIVL